MPTVRYVAHDGKERVVEVAVGDTVMRGAVANAVPGIDADCGGQCACATCHVYVDESWMAKAGAPSDMEASMLGFVDGVQPTSRLSCQIQMTADLDGLVVKLPKSQH